MALNKKGSFPKLLLHGRHIALGFFTAAILLYICIVIIPPMGTSSYQATETTPVTATTTTKDSEILPPAFVVTHLPTPEPLKGIYMTSWVAGTKSLRTKLVQLIDETEINSVVIDIKDYTGRISFEVDDPELQKIGSVENRISDIKEFIDELHKKNIYVIGRLSVFQDAYMVKHRPEWAVRRSSDGGVWQDHKGISWIDAGATPYWDYILKIADASYAVGFDEINYDYIRFPSDGNMKDIAYPFSKTRPKPDVLKDFFEYVHAHAQEKKIPISADLFGMTTTNRDDLNIGQVLENALPNFDYIAPMVYPSHYPPHFNGYDNPAAKPYEVIVYSMGHAQERARAFAASSSVPVAKMRPWLQDFSIGGTTYTPGMVRDQITATYDVGISSWLLWNASNRYMRDALMPYPSGVAPVGKPHPATSTILRR